MDRPGSVEDDAAVCGPGKACPDQSDDHMHCHHRDQCCHCGCPGDGRSIKDGRNLDHRSGMTDRETVMLDVLNDLESSVRMGDLPRCSFIAFVWSQRRDHLLAGEETWADQRIPDVSIGGTVPIIERARG